MHSDSGVSLCFLPGYGILKEKIVWGCQASASCYHGAVRRIASLYGVDITRQWLVLYCLSDK
jgi:hypothetical protein